MSDSFQLKIGRTKPEFEGLTEAEIVKALGDAPLNSNPIAAEVTRLVSEFYESFRSYAVKHGPFAPENVHVTTHCPIEMIAIKMAMKAVLDMASERPRTLH